MGFWNLNASSSKAAPPNPSETVSTNKEQVFKRLSLRESFSFGQPQWWRLSWNRTAELLNQRNQHGLRVRGTWHKERGSQGSPWLWTHPCASLTPPCHPASLAYRHPPILWRIQWLSFGECSHGTIRHGIDAVNRKDENLRSPLPSSVGTFKQVLRDFPILLFAGENSISISGIGGTAVTVGSEEGVCLLP